MTKKTFNYVVSYLFSPDLKQVLLIRKKRPATLSGKLTGVGGKIENYDLSTTHAIVREVLEESNMQLDLSQFTSIGSVEGYDYSLESFFAKVNEKQFSYYKNMIDEELFWVSVSDIFNGIFDIDDYADNALLNIYESHEILKNKR